MDKTIIAANWKSNKTKIEAQKWLSEIALKSFPSNLEVIVFPPFTLLDYFSSFIRVNDIPLKIGAQDVSPFGSGAYTGEVAAEQIKEFADYVLIGHSERRSNFSESNELISQKIQQSVQQGLKPIVCIFDLQQLEGIPEEAIISYEPVGAIGTGQPQDPGQVAEFAKNVKAKSNCPIIYGGSVSPDNMKNYLSIENVSGLLIGGQSLDENSFMKIIENAS